MRNRILTILILTCFILLLFGNLLSISIYDSRPMTKRVHSMSSTWVQDYLNGSRNTVYYYGSDNTSLIDSITVSLESTNHFTNQTTITETEYSFVSSFETINNQTVLTYLEYSNHASLPSSNFIFTFDDLNRINRIYMSSLSVTGATTDWQSRTIYYNGFNKPDSILNETNYSSPTKHLFSYDTSLRLGTVVEYQQLSGDTIWEPEYREILTYAEGVQPYVNPLQFAQSRLQMLLYGCEDLMTVLDCTYLPLTITSQYWYQNSWNNYSGTIAENFTNNEINIYTYSGNTSENYLFSNLGLYTGGSTDSSSEYYTSYSNTNVFWEDITPNEDEYQSPAPSQLTLSTYPNPFKTNLKIKLNTKDKAPSDISIYNIKGQFIRSWKDNKATELSWDGKDNASQPVSSGMYLIRAKQGKSIITAKVIKY